MRRILLILLGLSSTAVAQPDLSNLTESKYVLYLDCNSTDTIEVAHTREPFIDSCGNLYVWELIKPFKESNEAPYKQLASGVLNFIEIEKDPLMSPNRAK